MGLRPPRPRGLLGQTRPRGPRPPGRQAALERAGQLRGILNYYDILGVPRDATQDQVRSAYRSLVQLFHPDRLRHLRPEVRSFAEERLKTLNQAYEVLGDP